ncbi:hypothetical protein HT031_002848 [Scenedesmus sp. PABB004]|nr:hypothetical protein HT031_002848 [Scenedesmus sp. PABB004]
MQAAAPCAAQGRLAGRPAPFASASLPAPAPWGGGAWCLRRGGARGGSSSGGSGGSSAGPRRVAGAALVARAERREYYDAKDMPPLPLTVSRIAVPTLGHTVVDEASKATRAASLAIFYDIWQDAQYAHRLSRRSAITALCMYDRDDVAAAREAPGAFPNIDLLHRIYNEGLDVEFVVEEAGGGARPAAQ